MGDLVPKLGTDRREIGSPDAELPAENGWVAIADVRTERLHPGPVDGCAARLPTTTDKDAGTAGARTVDQLLGEPALADARLACEQEETPAAGKRAVQAGEKLC